jgi:hypothetical protein
MFREMNGIKSGNRACSWRMKAIKSGRPGRTEEIQEAQGGKPYQNSSCGIGRIIPRLSKAGMPSRSEAGAVCSKTKVPINKERFASIYKEPLRGTSNSPPRLRLRRVCMLYNTGKKFAERARNCNLVIQQAQEKCFFRVPVVFLVVPSHFRRIR